jgi:hypothetical protein
LKRAGNSSDECHLRHIREEFLVKLRSGFQIFEQALGSFGVVGGALEHEPKDGIEEAFVFGESGDVVGGERGFDGLLRSRCDEFKAAHENADSAGWRGIDMKRENATKERGTM